MKVSLLAHTDCAEGIVAASGKTCYSKDTPSECFIRFVNGIDDDLRKQLSIIHGSCFEHAVFSFGVEGVSRDCTHQLVRHRLASFSQQSQRYVRMEGDKVYCPQTVIDSDDAEYLYYKCIDEAFSTYDKLLEMGIPKEDARYVLPGATYSNIVVTMNARELHHFFGLRCCRRAQAEIRELADEMLRLCKEVAPELFRDAGPQCEQMRYCPEHRSCGCAPTMDELQQAWKNEAVRRNVAFCAEEGEA